MLPRLPALLPGVPIDLFARIIMSRFTLPFIINTLRAVVATPTITAQGTGGAATWGYKIVGVDANGRETAASAEGQETSGNAALDETDFNRITWTDSPGCVSFKIYRVTSGGTPATLGLIGTVLAGVETFDDTGLVGDASTANATNNTGDGEALDLGPFNGTVEASLYGTFSGAYQLQGRYGGDDLWTDEGAALTAIGVVAVADKFLQLRWRNEAYTSGGPGGYCAGDNH